MSDVEKDDSVIAVEKDDSVIAVEKDDSCIIMENGGSKNEAGIEDLPSLAREAKQVWESRKYGKVFCLTFEEDTKGFHFCEKVYSGGCLIIIIFLTLCVELIPAGQQLANLREANKYIEDLSYSMDEDYQLEMIEDGIYLREHLPCLTLAPESEEYCPNNLVSANFTISETRNTTACPFCDSDRGYEFVNLSASLLLCGYSTPNMREAGVSAMCTDVDRCETWIVRTRHRIVDQSRRIKKTVSDLIIAYLFFTIGLPLIATLIWIIATKALKAWCNKLWSDEAYRKKMFGLFLKVYGEKGVGLLEKLQDTIFKDRQASNLLKTSNDSGNSDNYILENVEKLHRWTRKCHRCVEKFLNFESWVVLYIFCGIPFVTSNLMIGYMYGVVDGQRNLFEELNITGCWLTSSSLHVYENLFDGFLGTIYIQIFMLWMSFAEQVRLIFHLTNPFKLAYVMYLIFSEEEIREKVEKEDGLKEIVQFLKSLYEINEVSHDPMTVLFSLVAACAFLLGNFWGASSSGANTFFCGYLLYMLLVWLFLAKVGGREAIYKSPYNRDFCKYFNCPQICMCGVKKDRRKLFSCPAYCNCENDLENKDICGSVCCFQSICENVRLRNICKPICRYIRNSEYCIFEFENENDRSDATPREVKIKNLLAFWGILLFLVVAIPTILFTFLQDEHRKFS